VIDVHAYAEAKLKGIQCHASQLSPDNPYQQEEFDPTASTWFLQETFILAQCHPDIQPAIPADRKEDDLFTGLR
jgi:hypothetical protein